MDRGHQAETFSRGSLHIPPSFSRFPSHHNVARWDSACQFGMGAGGVAGYGRGKFECSPGEHWACDVVAGNAVGLRGVAATRAVRPGLHSSETEVGGAVIATCAVGRGSDRSADSPPTRCGPAQETCSAGQATEGCFTPVSTACGRLSPPTRRPPNCSQCRAQATCGGPVPGQPIRVFRQG